MPVRDHPPDDIGIGVLDSLLMPFVVIVLLVTIIVWGLLMLCALPFEAIDWICTKILIRLGWIKPEPQYEGL